MSEVWLKIPSFPEYAISDAGRVMRIRAGNSPIAKVGRILKASPTKRGYVVINLMRDKKECCVQIARLMAEAFIPNPEGKKHVNHLDGNKSHNSLDNLEWATQAENTQHAWNLGLIRPRRTAEECHGV